MVGHDIIDRARPRLPDAADAVLGLVVYRRRPIALDEQHVGGVGVLVDVDDVAAVGVNDCSAWLAEVQGRATSVDILSLDLGYPSGTTAGDPLLVTMKIDADNSSAGFLSAATALIPGVSVILPDKFTITAESRAELIGSQTSCSG